MDAEAALGPSSRHRRSALLAAGGAGVLAYGWWATGLRPFTWGALGAILVPGVALVVTSPKLRASGPSIRSWFASQRQQIDAQRAAGYATWASVLGAIVLWQLVNFFWSPRADHPTLSSMLGTVEDHPGRLVLFALWLLLGWYLTRR